MVVSAQGRFRILIALVFISGFSQGMLLPLLSIILEQGGVSSSVNGLHAAGLYIGILIASPFMEKPMRRFGFKPLIMTGGLLVLVSLVLFPLWQSLWFWFILRVTVGIGDNMLHFGTQTWITTTSPAETRGKHISIYGLSFGLGFAVGPFMTQLLTISEALPFLISAALSAIIWSTLFFLRNKWPADRDISAAQTSSLSRFIEAGKKAWIALLPAFGYGFLEAALHGIFPVYGLRIGHSVDTLSFIIPFFAGASIITQIPLGVLSDRWGRRKVLFLVMTSGLFTFLLAALFETSAAALLVAFAASGMLVGSLYSLSIAFMTDLLPASLLPSGNVLVSAAFSLGSLIGPYLGGLFIDHFPHISFFHLIIAMLLLLLTIIYLKRDAGVKQTRSAQGDLH